MRIAVDIQAIQSWSSKGRGIGRYIIDFVDALLKREDLDLTLLTNPKRPMTADVLELTTRATVKSIADTDWIEDLDWYVISSPVEMDLSIDDLWPPQVRGRTRTAAIVYDLIPLHYSDQYLAYAPYEISYKQRVELLSSFDLLMAISEATARDLREHFGDQTRVMTIGTGVPSAFNRVGGVSVDPYDEIPDLKPGFIMYTGGGDSRKNVPLLIDAYGCLPAETRTKHQLVLVYRLTDHERTLLSEQCVQLGIADDVLVTGYIPDETLRSLYAATHLFVFPSLYEGFGLPIVEASLNGAPVIASDSSSMIELIQDERLRFDPTEKSEISAAIQKALEREDLESIAASQRDYISARFTWERVATAAIESMKRVGAGKTKFRSRDTAVRPRIALIGPLPPQHSGVADYMWCLLPHLAQDVDIVCVVEVEARAGIPLPPDGVSVVTVPEFEAMRRVQPFDETVIVMGNSTFHHYCWDLLTEISGVVLAHELRYTGLFQSYASLRGMGHGFFRDLLLQEYAGLHPSLDLQQFLESDVAADLGIHLVGPIIDRASRFLTTSEHAEQVARLVRPTRSDDIESVGFAYPDTATQVSIERPMPPILASIGIQWHTKRTMDLVRTLSIVQESIPDVRLRLVGPIDETYASDVKTLARELGVHSAVSVLGRVPRDDLEREIASASLALQLRATSNGEVSAAIADCIVAGTPVITTSIGAQTELADAGVELLHLAATPADIAEAVVSILEDDAYREDMSTRGMRWASERDPALAADRLLSAIGLASDRS